MTSVVFAIPGSIAAPTGGYGYAREIIHQLELLEIDVSLLSLPETFPRPDGTQLSTVVRMLGNVPSRAGLIMDGLSLGTLPPALIRALGRPIIGLVHHPLGYEPGLDEDVAQRLLVNEKAGLAACAGVIVSSETTRQVVTDVFDIPASRVYLAAPGTARFPEPARRSEPASEARPPRLLAVGSVIPRKGYDVLVDALAKLRKRPWSLDLVGSATIDAQCARDLAERVVQSGLDDRIALLGERSATEVSALYEQADIFVLPSRYEGYGMAFTEAMSHGLPVIAADIGHAPKLVTPDTGILVPNEDAGALARAIDTLIKDRELRHRLGHGGWLRAQELPDWQGSARIIADVIRSITS